ncbi:MAG: (d)CMP kinase [Bacillota bacterium]|nr:(d)CMP kinase [Bacillota bacterium]
MADKQLISIAVDGPVSAGKSSLCDALSQKLGILHLDTGAMYRAVGLFAIKNNISPDDEEALEAVVKNKLADISVDYQDGRQITKLNGEDVSALLRSEKVGAYASAVSRFPVVRRYLVSLQQQLARERSLLIDGRDIGTVVLPDAKVKIFLTASPEERALRRYKQLINAGSKADYNMVLSDLLARDEQDKNRKADPLRAAPDAVILDTSKLNFEESLQEMINIVKAVYDN